MVANEVYGFFPDNKEIKLLDYGCGTGVVADFLFDEHGFKNIDGTNPCKELIDEARKKGTMQKLYKIGSNDSHACFPDNHYDAIISSGVFFVSPSHPGFEIFTELCRMIKKGGYLIISTANHYLQYGYVHFKILEDLEKQGVLQILAQKNIEKYRKPIDESGGEGQFISGVV